MRRTLLGLFALVAVLGFFWVRKEREILEGGPRTETMALCPGLEIELVRAIRIDHLQRAVQVKLERDAQGRWFLTDPVAYPALSGLVRTLLTTLVTARADPADEVDPRQVGLDPPQAVVECVMTGASGDRTIRIELGGQDVVPDRIFVRVPGHPGAAASGGSEIFRTTRALANTLERYPDDYRDKRATTMPATEVTALRRRGQVYLAEYEKLVNLDFDALLESDGWKRVTLPTVTLDPTAIGLLIRGAADLQVDDFVDDSPEDLAPYGLAEPAFTVELQPLRGSPVVLRFGHAAVEGEHDVAELDWFCQREGYEHVWRARTQDVNLLVRPADLFFDQRVLRLLREEVASIELEGGGSTRVLARVEDGWTVSEGDGPTYPAEPGAVEEVLSVFEREELGNHLVDVPFAAEEPPLSVTIVLRNDARQGGRIGKPARDDASGAQGRMFLRLGDEVAALADADIAEPCTRALDSFRSRSAHRFQESLVRSIELVHGERTYTFVNLGDNRWRPKGESLDAPADFVDSLEQLLHPPVRRWLSEGTPADDEQAIAVVLQPTNAEAFRFTLARASDGSATWSGPDGQRAEIDAPLVERLLKLFP